MSVAGGKKSKFSTGAVAGIAVAGGVLVIALILVGLFALRQKRRNKELKERSTDPFGKDKYTNWSCSFCYTSRITVEQSAMN